MKPERSELVMIEEEEQKSESRAFTPEIRGLLGDLLERAFIKAVRFITNLWAPKVGGQEEGGGKDD